MSPAQMNDISNIWDREVGCVLDEHHGLFDWQLWLCLNSSHDLRASCQKCLYIQNIWDRQGLLKSSVLSELVQPWCKHFFNDLSTLPFLYPDFFLICQKTELAEKPYTGSLILAEHAWRTSLTFYFKGEVWFG